MSNSIRAVVILAEHEGKIILVDQPRVPLGCRCVELPAGLVGDIDPKATVEGTAIKELEEETGFTADRVEVLGEFYSSPGMLSEGFTLVRAHAAPRRSATAAGTSMRTSTVHLVARCGHPQFPRAEASGRLRRRREIADLRSSY